MFQKIYQLQTTDYTTHCLIKYLEEAVLTGSNAQIFFSTCTCQSILLISYWA